MQHFVETPVQFTAPPLCPAHGIHLELALMVIYSPNCICKHLINIHIHRATITLHMEKQVPDQFVDSFERPIFSEISQEGSNDLKMPSQQGSCSPMVGRLFWKV